MSFAPAGERAKGDDEGETKATTMAMTAARARARATTRTTTCGRAIAFVKERGFLNCTETCVRIPGGRSLRLELYT